MAPQHLAAGFRIARDMGTRYAGADTVRIRISETVEKLPHLVISSETK
ncbi:MAG: hypothetical protein Q8R16_04435 [bacterium]|nr:hypothetical protein [bacterium]